jgi:glycerophosphoryl diester phosphodiesterase
MVVNVWTVNGEDEMRRLAAVGVDAIITDVTDVARRVFDSR